MLDDWLRETLLIAFDQIEAVPGALEDEFPRRLLKSSRSHLELHRERPDGYDAMSAKGKNKGWQDSKLFFVTRLPVPSVIDILNTLFVHSHKGKGKAVQKRPIDDKYGDDEPLEYNTQSKKRKGTVASAKDEIGTTKPSVGNPDEVFVIDSDSDEAASRNVKISTPTLEAQFEDLEASIVVYHKRHGFSSPPPTTVNPWSTVLGTAVPAPAGPAPATPDAEA
ncbi:hypothetical protein K439DRAFT_106164 [Ramaria rubella]|nr:hypothetical protein K439DRAFT_106164 [Ramaria rubella]